LRGYRGRRLPALLVVPLLAWGIGLPGGTAVLAAPPGHGGGSGGPNQRVGSAAGLPHTASSQATRAPGRQPGRATARPPGALPPYHPVAPVRLPTPAAKPETVRLAGTGKVPKLTGFDPATSKEVISRRTAREQTFANADGSFTTRFYRYPTATRRPDGSWAAIDTSLHPAPARVVRHGWIPENDVTTTSGGWQAQAGSDTVAFGAAADAVPLVQLTLDASHTVGYSLAGAAASPGQAVEAALAPARDRERGHVAVVGVVGVPGRGEHVAAVEGLADAPEADSCAPSWKKPRRFFPMPCE